MKRQFEQVSYAFVYATVHSFILFLQTSSCDFPQDYLEDSFSSTYEVDGPLFRASSREEVKRARSLLLTLADTTYTVHSLSDDGDVIKTRQYPLLWLASSCGLSLNVQGAAQKILYGDLKLLTALLICLNLCPG